MNAVELPRRCRVGEVGISVVDMDRALRILGERAESRTPAYVCVANVDATVLSQRDPEFRRIQNESYLTLPDGMPLVWYARMMGEKTIERVTGPDLMMRLLGLSKERGYSHYFYGDTDDTLQRIRRRIEERYAGATILRMHSPPFRPPTEEEIDRTVAEINELRPTFVWVGLGCPKQERWMGRVFPRIESSILIGVGAAFRFLIGEYRHPPRIVQMCGLEGIYWRGLHRPAYCAKWYARHVPAFGSLFVRGFARRLAKMGRLGHA